MTMHTRATSKPGSVGMADALVTPPTNTVGMVKALREGHNIKSDMRVDEFMKGGSALETSANADTRMTTLNRKSLGRVTNRTIGVTHFDVGSNYLSRGGDRPNKTKTFIE